MLPSAMMQRNPPPLPKAGVSLRLPEAPPQASEEQMMKGGHALRKMKRYCEELFQLNNDYNERVQEQNLLVQRLLDQRSNLEAELQEKNDRIAQLKQRDQNDNRIHKSQEEVEKLLHEEMRKRLKAENESAEKSVIIEQLEAEHITEVEALKHDIVQNEEQKSLVLEQEQAITILRQRIKDLEFNLDEKKVLALQFERQCGISEKQLAELSQKYEDLLTSEAAFKEENGQLQKRVRDILDANRAVTLNYQAVKKNQEHKRSEFEALVNELEEAKTACQLAIKQKKQIQIQSSKLAQEKKDLVERSNAMENLLNRKEKDIADLLTKVNDTINGYEQKLEKKEEQMWQMSLQMSEAAEKAQVEVERPPAAVQEDPRARTDIDPEFADNLEKKYQIKEKIIQNELDRMRDIAMTKDKQIAKLNEKIEDLNREQYLPRMERLKAIEVDIKAKMEEYALAEEGMETGFLCPRDVKLFHKPMTLMPCGHTYCQECISAIREENFNVLKCQMCTVPVRSVFQNEQLEGVAEQFSKRRELTLAFLDWVQKLRSILPTEVEEKII